VSYSVRTYESGPMRVTINYPVRKATNIRCR